MPVCNCEINQLQTPQFVDIVPSLSTASSVVDSLDNDDNDDDDDDYSEDASGDEPRRKTRRSRRGGYRRKRQQQKKVAALMAESAARRAQKAAASCCDNSTTTSTTESESSSCDSSAASTPPRVVAHKRLDAVNNYNSSSFSPVRDPVYNSGYPTAAKSPPNHVNSYNNNTYARNKHNNNNRMPYLQPESFLAMDCEMVGVGKDGTQSALARVSILDYHGNAVMDEYIKPGRKVTDYRSFVSGITPEILQTKAKMDYATCRKKVIKLLRGKVLVGHALENDLGILRINHPWNLIRDTAQYQPFMKVRAGAYWPRRLQDLALERLHRDVQVYGRPHCSAQDSLAALDLYKLVSREWEASIIEHSSWLMQQQHQQQHFQLQQQQHYAPVYAM